ncbi:hypothetical protein ACFVIY_41825 [Streptomyces sp. NPDC127166]|uniref:hypothetical protein n=1 Tax=Streptomyces sp. NPDC127166 TaxID=3345380 RepID=UPI0036407C9F
MSLPTWLQNSIATHDKRASLVSAFTMVEVKPLPVVARYLTVAGAHVVIREITLDLSHGSDVPATFAECGGCTDAQYFEWNWDDEDLSRPEKQAKARTEARAWSQAHAETCRAIPMEG